MSNDKPELNAIFGRQFQDGRLIPNFSANTLKMGANALTIGVWEMRKELLSSYWTRFMKTNSDSVAWSGNTDFETSRTIIIKLSGPIRRQRFE